MPTPYIKKMAKETGKSLKKLEKLWKKAEKIAGDKFTKEDDAFHPYVMGIFQRMLGVHESTSFVKVGDNLLIGISGSSRLNLVREAMSSVSGGKAFLEMTDEEIRAYLISGVMYKDPSMSRFLEKLILRLQARRVLNGEKSFHTSRSSQTHSKERLRVS